MNVPFNELTPAEVERLALLAEECAEVIQVIGKILRHGYESVNPKDRDGPANREMLQNELGDIDAAISLLEEAGDVHENEITKAAAIKMAKVAQYLHEQPIASARRAQR
jgi:NTP pyrophosphatase (non-canonical NTP hydrolase)